MKKENRLMLGVALTIVGAVTLAINNGSSQSPDVTPKSLLETSGQSGINIKNKNFIGAFALVVGGYLIFKKDK